jgi:CopG antitoxin of type II toxin-antitoxin system
MKERKQSRIPRFKTREEEAEFWDTHSLADFADELKEVSVKVERPLGHILGVRLNAKTIDALAAIGRKKGIGPSTLARIWIMERLSELEGEEQQKKPRQAPVDIIAGPT